MYIKDYVFRLYDICQQTLFTFLTALSKYPKKQPKKGLFWLIVPRYRLSWQELELAGHRKQNHTNMDAGAQQFTLVLFTFLLP